MTEMEKSKIQQFTLNKHGQLGEVLGSGTMSLGHESNGDPWMTYQITTQNSMHRARLWKTANSTQGYAEQDIEGRQFQTWMEFHPNKSIILQAMGGETWIEPFKMPVHALLLDIPFDLQGLRPFDITSLLEGEVKLVLAPHRPFMAYGWNVYQGSLPEHIQALIPSDSKKTILSPLDRPNIDRQKALVWHGKDGVFSWQLFPSAESIKIEPITEESPTGQTDWDVPEPPENISLPLTLPKRTKKIWVESRSGQKLRVYLDEPEHPDPKKPNVVLLHCSGPETGDGGLGADGRDHIFDARATFLKMGAWLTEHGYHVTRFDKRGVRESEGNFLEAGFSELIEDAEDVIAKTTKDGTPTVLVGFSEGANMALKISANMTVDGIVLCSCPATGISEIVLKKPYNQANPQFLARWQEFFDGLSGEDGATTMMGYSRKWWREHDESNPTDAARKCKAKQALILHGTMDREIPVEHSDQIASALGESGCMVEHHKLEGLNHVFTVADTEIPGFNYTLPKIPDAACLDQILAFLEKVTKSS